jgi:hypothetical protein
MKYKDVIQELKESPDKNIAAFLEDVEKKKRLSKRERQLYLARLQDPSVADALASDCIPSIIRVAYRYSKQTKRLSFLDLVGEGVVGVYSCINKYKYKQCGCTDRLLRTYIFCAIQRQVCKHACPFAFHSFDEDDPQLYKGVENEWGISPRPKKPVVTERIFDFNPYGVRVRRCCASCSHRDISRAVSSRYCTEHHKDVNPNQMCSLWKMSDLLRTLKPGE